MSSIPPLSPLVIADLERLARTELSLGARIRYVLLALVASAMTIVVISLITTEPTLPTRTTAAFALLALIGAGWTVFSLWVLRTKHVMLATHRLIGARLATAFTGLFAGGSVLLALTSEVRAAGPLAGMSLAFFAAAVVLWRRASTSYTRLQERRAALKRTLAARPR